MVIIIIDVAALDVVESFAANLQRYERTGRPLVKAQ